MAVSWGLQEMLASPRWGWFNDAQERRTLRFLITCAVVLGYAANASAETWTVDDDGPADFDNIQAAVEEFQGGIAACR